MIPRIAMVLAAGLGTRMKPLTDDRPKALVEVADKALIDHVLDRLEGAGVETAVVNVHAFADKLEAHLARRKRPKVIISDERAQLLETGGGLKKARPLLGDGPALVANIDSIWIDDEAPVFGPMAHLWDPAKMDVLLLLARMERSIGFDGPGDFFLEEDGRLRFRGDAPSAPFAYMGLHVTKTEIVADGPEGPFSLAAVWRKLAEQGRLYGVVMEGTWMHVGDPTARDEAETQLLPGGP